MQVRNKVYVWESKAALPEWKIGGEERTGQSHQLHCLVVTDLATTEEEKH